MTLDELRQRLRGSRGADFPERLREHVRSAPHRHPERPRVVAVGGGDEQFRAGRVVALTHGVHAVGGQTVPNERKQLRGRRVAGLVEVKVRLNLAVGLDDFADAPRCGFGALVDRGRRDS